MSASDPKRTLRLADTIGPRGTSAKPQNQMTCLETYATLRVFSQATRPVEIGRILGVEATRISPIDSESKYRNRRENHFWAWSSDSIVQSLDSLEHVRAVISLLQDKETELAQLREAGCDIDVCCYWVSSGQGGPFLDNHALTGLARLGLEIWWDVYFGKEEDYEKIPRVRPIPPDRPYSRTSASGR